MADEIAIDGAGRLVIPKAIRDRYGLRPGSRLRVIPEEGRIVLTPERREPQLVERGGFFALDLGEGHPGVEHDAVRDGRLRELVQYALKR